MDKSTMSRKEKEDYLVKMLQEDGLLGEGTRYKEKIEKVPEEILDIKIEYMELYLDKN